MAATSAKSNHKLPAYTIRVIAAIVVVNLLLMVPLLSSYDPETTKDVHREIAVGIRSSSSGLFDTVPITLITMPDTANVLILHEQDGKPDANIAHVGQVAVISVYKEIGDDLLIPKNSDSFDLLLEFRFLFEAFPRQNWFVLIPSNSFIFFDNLLMAIKDLCLSNAHYFAITTKHGNKNEQMEPTAIILSRQTIMIIIAEYDECKLMFTVGSGTQRLDQCLKHIGIQPSNLIDIQHNIKFPANACKYPSIWTGIMPETMQYFSHILSTRSQESRNGIVSYQDLASESVQGFIISNEPNSRYYAETETQCIKTCRESPKCIGFNYFEKVVEEDNCELFLEISGFLPRLHTMMGVLTDRYLCVPRDLGFLGI